MSPTPVMPGLAAAPVWRSFAIAAAAVFVVLLDTTAVVALVPAVGPASGSWGIEISSWRWAFLINVPLGAVAWWLARRDLAESTSSETGARLDLPGICLLASGIAALSLPVDTRPVATVEAVS